MVREIVEPLPSGLRQDLAKFELTQLIGQRARGIGVDLTEVCGRPARKVACPGRRGMCLTISLRPPSLIAHVDSCATSVADATCALRPSAAVVLDFRSAVEISL